MSATGTEPESVKNTAGVGEARVFKTPESVSVVTASGSETAVVLAVEPMADPLSDLMGLDVVISTSDRLKEWKQQVDEMEWCRADSLTCVVYDCVAEGLELAKKYDLAALDILFKAKGCPVNVAQYLYRKMMGCPHAQASAEGDEKSSRHKILLDLIEESGIRKGVSQRKTDLPDFFYDRKSHNFWVAASDGTWQSITNEKASDMLGVAGLSSHLNPDGSPSEVDRHLLHVIGNQGVDAAMALAGYTRGLHEVSGIQVLVPKSFNLIEPRPYNGDDQMRHVLNLVLGLFGETQMGYVFGHLRQSYLALRNGYQTGAPANFVCGPVDCGKSLFLEGVVIPLLGGRRGSAYSYLSGLTAFNDELIYSEVWAIDDGVPFADAGTRRKFGALVKQSVAAGGVPCHGKGKAQLTLPLYRRLWVMLNPQDLELMPPLDDSLRDKFSIFKASPFVMPKDCLPLPRWEDREKFMEVLEQELPYFIQWLLEFDFPTSLSDRRFGIKTYKHPELLHALNEVSGLDEKAILIQKVLFDGPTAKCFGMDAKELKAAELYEVLMESSRAPRCKDVFRNPRALGIALGELRSSKEYGKLVTDRILEGITRWTITCDPELIGTPIPMVCHEEVQ